MVVKRLASSSNTRRFDVPPNRSTDRGDFFIHRSDETGRQASRVALLPTFFLRRGDSKTNLARLAGFRLTIDFIDRKWNMKKLRFCPNVCLIVVAVLAASLLSGCGGSDDGPKLVPVSGKVTLAGSPLPGVGISFRPDKAKGNKSVHEPSGTADAEGKFELVAAAKNGAEVGWYKVVIIPATPAPTGGEMPQVGPPPFNVKYTDVTTTDLTIEVKAGAAPGAYDLTLTK